MDAKIRDEANECLSAIGELADTAQGSTFTSNPGGCLVPMRVLLEHVDELINGKAEARDKKNAGDRARRARAKKTTRTPGTGKRKSGKTSQNPGPAPAS